MNQSTLRTQKTGANRSIAHPSPWATSFGLLALALCAPLLAQAGTLKDRVAQGNEATSQGHCPFFDVAMAHKIFPNSSNEAVFKLGGKTYPSCTYIWAAKTKTTMKMAGRDVQIPSEGRLTITKAPSRVAAKDWERVLMGYRNQQLTPVPELGQYAAWSTKRSQLSWIAKGQVFHVAVQDNDHPDAQQKNAMAVAAELMRTH